MCTGVGRNDKKTTTTTKTAIISVGPVVCLVVSNILNGFFFHSRATAADEVVLGRRKLYTSGDFPKQIVRTKKIIKKSYDADVRDASYYYYLYVSRRETRRRRRRV